MNVQEYGRPLSTVFATTVQDPSQYENEEDVDPVLPALRVVVYRYLNFVYNPLDDQFQLVNGWKDPAWVNTKVMRAGLDADERDSRELVFGQNLIDLKQPSLLQLLMNEVSDQPAITTNWSVLIQDRSCIRSISFRLPASRCGPWMNITTTPSASS